MQAKRNNQQATEVGFWRPNDFWYDHKVPYLVLFILWQIFDLQHENLTATGHNDDRKRGCLAEYICCNVDRLVEKPSCLTFEEVNSDRLECRKTHHNSAFTIRFPDQAASLPVCAMTAWAALFEQGKCTPGARVSYPKLFLLFA